MKSGNRCNGQGLVCAVIIYYAASSGGVLMAQVNQWTNTMSGSWEQPFWSLGVLPDSSQDVQIANPGFKAVAIGSSTIQVAASSLTIKSLLISAPPDALSVLLLNYAGDQVPLRVLAGVTVATNGQLINLHSGLAIADGALSITNGMFIQDQGFVAVSNGPINLDGSYACTNGSVSAASLLLGIGGAGEFRQQGAVVSVGEIICGVGETNSGQYTLSAGWLSATNLQVGGKNTFCQFTQDGGTNTTDRVVVSALFNTSPEYRLHAGLLSTRSTQLDGATLVQTGGMHVALESVDLEGGLRQATELIPARYTLSGGDLQAPLLDVSDYASFVQSNGTAEISTALQFRAPLAFQRTASYLAGGALSCATVTSSGVGADLVQTGGTLTVTNLLSFAGTPNNPPLGPATYDFTGGTLVASNIEILATMNISGSGAADAIRNPGRFSLGGILTVSNSSEQLGDFVLEKTSTIQLEGTTARLGFGDSHNQMWNPTAQLQIANWDGSTNGGGSDQVRFGTDATALTLAQLEQIRFVGPAGTNYAQILSTGEVVPATKPPGPLVLNTNLQIRLIMRTASPDGSESVRLARDPRDHSLYYLKLNGDVYHISQIPSNGLASSTLIYTAADHGLSSAVEGMAIGPNGTMYLCGNNVTNDGNYTYARVVKGVPDTNGIRSWSLLAQTEPYPLSKTAFDHLCSGLAVSPDGNFVFLNSGSRTDHGEVQSAGGLFPGLRDVPLTAKIFRLPANGSGILLPIDLNALRSAGYVFAEGTRNAFDLAFNAEKELFAVDNGPDRDMPDELNWLRTGSHYGFPWRMGGMDNPQQFPSYNPATDPLLDPRFIAVALGYYHNDPTFPPPPTNFAEPILNFGPDADEFRDPSDGSIKDASALGVALTTFTQHRAPLGLIFDTAGALAPPFQHHGFVLGFTPGDPNDTGVAGPFFDPSQDLLDLELTKLGDTNYAVHATRIVQGFSLPVDTALIGHELYVIEYGGEENIWEITFPNAAATVALTRPDLRGNGSFEFTIEGLVPGSAYQVQSATNLTSWQGITNFVPSAANYSLSIPSEESDTQRFFRVVGAPGG